MVTFAGHAYPWDVNGDPGFADRVLGMGLDTVVLAAAYHAVRAATPLHPLRRTVDAPYAALYRRPARLDGPLQPRSATWLPEADPFGQAVNTLRDRGLRVEAWIVLTHNSRLGREFPQYSVVNCYGERYPYALCPSWPEVRSYAAALATAAIQDVEVDAVSLEACGQMGIVHSGHHDKAYFTPEEQRSLSVCCCDACRRSWPVPAPAVISALRSGVLPPEVLAVRQAATDALRSEILAALPTGMPVVLHGHPDPWETGSSPGLTPSAGFDVDSVLVPAWNLGTADLIAAGLPQARSVEGYLSVLPPTEPDALIDHARRLVSAGASRLSLYHLGLAGVGRQGMFTRIIGALT